MLALEIELESRFEFVFEQPTECSQKHPLEMSSEGSRDPARGSTLRHLGESPKKTTWRSKSIITVPWGIASRKAGLPHSVEHSPISLTLPLSSFGWLRNNSSSHSRSASFRNHAAKAADATSHHVLPPLLGAARARLGARSSRRREWVESEPFGRAPDS